MWSAIINAINTNHRFILSSHLNPDCDALGCELALARHLLSLGKDVAILNTDAVPKSYRFLDPDRLIQTFSKNNHADLLAEADVIVVLDASGWHRLGRTGEALAELEATVICIDHHPPEGDFADLSVVDTSAIATGELIFELITEMDGTVTLPIAEAIYAAILTDSGNFRFPKTTARTHRIIAQLLACGANPAQIYKRLYEQYSLAKLQLKGYILNHTKTTANGQLAYVGLTLNTLKKYDTASSELDGFSGLAQQIAGVRVTAFLVELPRGRVKISLRSDGSVPVNILAAQFGGGGHLPAAGAMAHGSLKTVTEQVIAAAEALLVE